MRVRLFFVGIGLLALVCGSPAHAADSSEADEQALEAAGLRTTGPSLLDFLRLRSQATPDAARLRTLAQRLADPSAEQREAAQAELIASGPAALPILRQTLHDADDTATAERARHCLRQIEPATAALLSTAAIRMLAQRKPAGATAALLAYLPFADDEDVARETQQVLATVAFPSGKVDPLLLRALDDPMPLRRTAAAEVLAGVPGGEHLSAILPLMQDRRPQVRLRIALALANARVEAAVPVLITLLAELPHSQAEQAERYLQYLAGDQAPRVTLDDEHLIQLYCRAQWEEWWHSYEGPALLDEFRKRTLTDAQRERILGQVRLLGNATFGMREKASRDLLGEGSAAVAVLRHFASDPDPEISQRVRKCLAVLERGALRGVPAAACRLVAMRKPEGAAEVVLGYVPYAEDEVAAKEIEKTLAALVLRDGKPDAIFLKTLADPVGVRRAAAAEALCQACGAEQWDTVRRLLRDADRDVRLRVALALTYAGDKEGVPALIDLVSELPQDQAWRAKDCLFRIAGDRPPALPAANDPELPKKTREAWTAWWRDNGAKIELARFDPSENLLGFTLLLDHENNGLGRVREIGPGGKLRWQIAGLQYPVDARVVAGNRVLIAEHGNRVTERDFDGKIIWTKQDFTDQPINLQRLPNGHTFIATEDELVEVDRTGQKVFSHRHATRDMMAAFKFADGQMVMITRQSMATRLDASGKVLRTFQIASSNYYGGIDGLPNGRLLVCEHDNNKVVEYDRDGKKVWSVSVDQPTTATRLANGHTVVTSYNNSRYVELDRAGRVLEQVDAKDGSRPYRVRRR
jgi:HEAT repeat protein